MQKPIKRPLTFRELRKAHANSFHPEHARVKAEWEEAWKRHEDSLSKVADALEPYEREADEFLELLKSDKRGDFRTLPPMNCLSVVFLISKIEDAEETRKKARVALARHAGRSPKRKGRWHPEAQAEIRIKWAKFVKDFGKAPDFRNRKARFITEMFEQYKLPRKNTLYEWIKEWSGNNG